MCSSTLSDLVLVACGRASERTSWTSLGVRQLGGKVVVNIDGLQKQESIEKELTHSHRVACHYLEKLPTELILEIELRLPLISSLSLALCNRRLFKMLSEPSLKTLRLDTYTRDGFIQTLSRDFLNAFICSRSRMIHFLLHDKRQGLMPEMWYLKTSQSRCKPRYQPQDEYFRPYVFQPEHTFTSEHAQIAMKLYQQGPCSDAYNFLGCASITQPELRKLNYDGDWGFDLFEAQLIHGRVCTRTQSWILARMDL